MTRVYRFLLRFLYTLDAQNPDIVSRCSIIWETTNKETINYAMLRVKLAMADMQ